MWRRLILLLGLLLAAPAAWGQYTTVTATVRDPNGVLYAGGSGRAVLVPQNQTYTINNSSFQTINVIHRIDSFGKFSMQLGDLNLISPVAQGWEFQICAIDGVTCFTVVIGNLGPCAITGPLVDISTCLQAAAAPIPISGIGNSTPGGSDTQIQYNCAGRFCGSANLRWNYLSNFMNMIGTFQITNTGVAGSIQLGDATSPNPHTVGWSAPFMADASSPTWIMPTIDRQGYFMSNGSSTTTFTASGTNGHCAQWAANGVLGDSGASCGGGSGSVTNFTAGNLSPIFTSSVATPTTTPALTFTIASLSPLTSTANSVSEINLSLIPFSSAQTKQTLIAGPAISSFSSLGQSHLNIPATVQAQSLNDSANVGSAMLAYVEDTALTADKHGSISIATQNGAGAATGFVDGAVIEGLHNGTGTASSVNGILTLVGNENTGTITQGDALRASVNQDSATGTITNGSALHVIQPTVTPGGTVTTLRGLQVDQQKVSGVTTSYAIDILGQNGGVGVHTAAPEDMVETTAPGNPPSGTDRIYTDSTTHLLTCLTSSGGSCFPGGGTQAGPTRPNTRRWGYANTGSGGLQQIGMGMAELNFSGSNIGATLSPSQPESRRYTATTDIMGINQTGSNAHFFFDWNILWQSWARFNNTGIRAVVGLSTTGSIATLLNDDTSASIGAGAIFRFSTAVPDTNIQCVTANGSGGLTVVDSGIAPDNLVTGHKFEIKVNFGTNIVFKIDGSTVCTITTNNPPTNFSPQGYIVAKALSGTKSIDHAWSYFESDF